MEKKAIVILGGGPEQKDAYLISLKKKIIIIGVDKNKNANSLNYANYKIFCSIYNWRKIISNLKIIKKKKKLKIIGIVSLAVDVPETLYNLSKKLKLSFINSNNFNKIKNKYNFYKCLKNKFNIPKFKIYKKKQDLFLYAKKEKFPFIIKPISDRGSRDIFLLKNKDNFQFYLKNKINLFKQKKLLLQKFIQGEQYSTESFIINKKVHTLIFKRNYTSYEKFHPYVIEDGGDSYFTMSKYKKLKLIKTVERLVKELDIKNGPLKCDFVLQKNNFYILEVALRFGGGFIASKASELLLGFNFVEAHIDKMINNSYVLKKYRRKQTFIKSLSTRTVAAEKKGKILKIKNFISQNLKKNILYISYNKKKGDRVNIPTSHAERLAFLIAFSKKNDASKKAELAASKIKFLIK